MAREYTQLFSVYTQLFSVQALQERRCLLAGLLPPACHAGACGMLLLGLGVAKLGSAEACAAQASAIMPFPAGRRCYLCRSLSVRLW